MTTRGGVSPRCNSAAPSRSTQRSTTPKSLETPVRRHLGELAIELATVLDERAHEKAGEPTLVGRHREIVPDLRRDAIEVLFAANVPRVERLKHARARTRFNSRP